MLISLVIPAHNEALQIPTTIESLQSVLPAEYSYEFIFIDDGSEDQTWAVLKAAQKEEPRLKLLRLSRNFGKESALLAGLDAVHPKSSALIVLDCDLQFPPQYIAKMLELWQSGYEIVAGRKITRQKESFFSRLKAKGFYRFFRRLSGYDLNNATDFQLWDRKVLEAWYGLSERISFFRGLSLWLGFKRCSFDFEVAEREHGESSWNFFSLLRLSLDAITGFSAKILLIIPILAGVFWLFFLILGIQTLYHFFNGQAATGFTTVILLQLLIGGAILFSISLIAIYIARLFIEVKGRPRYLLSELSFDQDRFSLHNRSLAEQEKELQNGSKKIF
ncbi:MAG: glycosyltransferase family 2 protein [Eubacteriales bacterium]|nr:glycosyltransferase family 2 protein [Eubacteriales bacterium]